MVFRHLPMAWVSMVNVIYILAWLSSSVKYDSYDSSEKLLKVTISANYPPTLFLNLIYSSMSQKFHEVM